MGATKIEWTDRVWNPVTGCSAIGTGCANCYARRMAKRLAGRCGYPADEPFRPTFHPERLDEPLRWTKPSRIFVGSMTDLFHEAVPTEWLEQVWATMHAASRHTYLILTKRPRRMRNLAHALDCLGLWLGVSCEDQAAADERIPLLLLLETPAMVRFISAEPLLGPLNLRKFIHGQGIHWVIAGGETGPGARPAHPVWFRSLRDQCHEAGVRFFFKGWGDWLHVSQVTTKVQSEAVTKIRMEQFGRFERSIHYWGPGSNYSCRVGKKVAGHLLDARLHFGVPNSAVGRVPNERMHEP